MAAAEVTKLQTHLALLREQYVKLQKHAAEIEQKYNLAVSRGAEASEETFVGRLLKIVASLFNQELYSDLTIHFDKLTLKAHKFVLEARSSNWGVPSLAEVSSLDFNDIPGDIGVILFKWVYTDQLAHSLPEATLLQLLAAAKRFSLEPLLNRCEKAIMSSVNMKNCIEFYQTAEEIGAANLGKYCSELIASHWDDFESEDFANVKASLLYQMLKDKCDYPLHASIKLKREDVVFLYLIEFDSQLSIKLNEVDGAGNLPLELALASHQESTATSLVSHGANVNITTPQGETLLHKAIKKQDSFSAIFLTENGALVNTVVPETNESPLHLAARVNNSDPAVLDDMARVAYRLMEFHANPNMQDKQGNTPLHASIQSGNEPVFTILLSAPNLDLELQNAKGHTALWEALEASRSDGGYHPNSLAARLIQRGASVDATSNLTGDTLLHLAAFKGMEEAGIFLVNHGASVNATNYKGMSPLHVACSQGLAALVSTLLRHGANPNLQTGAPKSSSSFPISTEGGESGGVSSNPFLQTPLHLAIKAHKLAAIQAILQHKAEWGEKGAQAEGGNSVIPNFNVADSEKETALSLAIRENLLTVADQLLAGGANINTVVGSDLTLLNRAILDQDSPAALFLLEHGADFSLSTKEGATPLELAVKRHLPAVVEALCQRGADLNILDADGNSPLWIALETGQQDVASILVRYGCDTNCWGVGPGGCYQTLLHKALDENNESISCFLIQNGCDISSPRRPGPDGRGEEEAYDGQTPLHLACSWGLESVVEALLEHKADPNVQDAEGKTPLHVAIANMSPNIITSLLTCPHLDINVRDKQGQTPFAAAMTMRNNAAAEAILAREPRAAEQPDNRGRNYLHLAIQKNDIESVLFLLSIRVNINSRVQDSSQLTPLQIAVKNGFEIIVRNLLLAEANVNDLTPQRQTCLHLAALEDHSVICSILLENGVDFDALDCNGNNALHLACQKGHLASCRVLLTESHINAEALNARGQNPLHVLAQNSKENSAAIFELFMECMPHYPLDKVDCEGNTALLLAYKNGNGQLSRAIVKAGACIGITNKAGENIFNIQVATRQLLTRLLDFLPNEPPWSEADNCMECGTKFGIKTRKHHCRHCGRVLCSKCSEKDIPILKFGLNKPVRVCDICFDVLTVGAL